jgi:hypothetical protein
MAVNDTKDKDRTYRRADLDAISHLISEAQQMAIRDADNVEDKGTCVLGAGIAVNYRGPRKRYDRTKVIVSSGRHQGNCAQHASCARALQFLRDNGVDAWWHDGAMD